MNNSINIANISPSKTSEATIASSTNTNQEGLDSAEANDSDALTGTFQESIKKAYDESKANTEIDNSEKVDAELSGNTLPLSDDLSELPAQDDRSLLATGLNITALLPATNLPLTQKAVTQPQALPLEIDADNIDVELNQLASRPGAGTDIGADAQLNVMSSQLRQLLKMEANSDNKKIQLTAVRTGESAKIINNGIETPLVQTSEILPVNTTQVEVTTDKSLALTNTANQQTLLPNIQSSLLLQTASAQGATNIEGLPLVANTTVNNLSTINMQSVPQAEITEAFARPAWSQAMSKQVLLMVNQNISTAEIRLNPAHLGPIEVLIDMSEEQVSVSMSSRHAIVREAMEQALPKLREMLDENGFTLADADISKRSFAEQRDQDADNERKNIAEASTDLSTTSEISGQAIRQVSMNAGVVDYYI